VASWETKEGECIKGWVETGMCRRRFNTSSSNVKLRINGRDCSLLSMSFGAQRTTLTETERFSGSLGKHIQYIKHAVAR
jgi:hypothetical protein